MGLSMKFGGGVRVAGTCGEGVREAGLFGEVHVVLGCVSDHG